MLTYKLNADGAITVILDGRVIGKIVKTIRGYKYTPKGHKVSGEEFATIAEVKQSLEAE